MKIELFPDQPNFIHESLPDLTQEDEVKSAEIINCKTINGKDVIEQSLKELGRCKPISAQDCLRRVRFKALRTMLRLAGEVTGHSVAHVSVLLGVTERTVRNWIVEAELGALFFGPQSSARILYRGVVRGMATDLTGSYPIGPYRTKWCANYSEAVRKSKVIYHSYRISKGNIEVETKKVRDD